MSRPIRFPVFAELQGRQGRVYALLAAALFMVVAVALPASLTGLEDDVDGLRGYFSFFFGVVLGYGILYAGLAYVVYRISSSRVRSLWIAAGLVLLFAALAFGFFLPPHAGVLDNFSFSEPAGLAPNATSLLIDAVVLLACVVAAVYLLARRLSWLLNGLGVALLASVVATGYSLYSIHERVSRKSEDELAGNAKLFSYSKTGKNVVMIFVDGAMSGYLPDIFADSPRLPAQFPGYTWYSNIVSTGNRTFNGLPAVFGGFDYTVSGINQRSGASLKEKVSDAYRLYVDNFSAHGYQVLYSDPFWFGLQRKGDCEYFNQRYEGPGIARCIHSIGKRIGAKKANVRKGQEDRLRLGLAHQYIALSLLRVAPTSLRESIYGKGSWVGLSYIWKKKEDKYLNNFFSLASMGELSDTAAPRDTFTFITNELPRAPLFLKGDCIPDRKLSDANETVHSLIQRYNSSDTAAIYQTTRCTVEMLGQYMDWFKAQGIYDNTMFVVVSDHGWVSHNPLLKQVPEQTRYSMFQSFLMIKPFGASGPIAESKQFIANASVPGIVCDVLGGCKDRVSGKVIRYTPVQGWVTLHETPWQPSGQGPDNYRVEHLYRVKEDVTQPKNWEMLR
ncbi:hypothetical protein [Eleftheria terrae]|uniref:hypothetical protein n=1 Tax=Eleftheria terrae TaxID=1597781 RepID=UPI00263B52C1|nr:hypothetical protein [Eleftheria terrae]WKB52628.1 hypothetical protein N7L95_23040 [Eleftheria terrae]